jgi:hypothetical protein
MTINAEIAEFPEETLIAGFEIIEDFSAFSAISALIVVVRGTDSA